MEAHRAGADVRRGGWGSCFALITVNFSTTRYLKLMLLTLCEQAHLGLVHRLVIVDNGSRDGGGVFVDRLAVRVPRVCVVHRRHWLGHGPGMRAAVRALDRIDGRDPRPANMLLFCDTDVVFRARGALTVLAGAALEHDAALLGEVRAGANHQPDIQASFFAVRRDVYARRDIAPLVHDGAPAYRLQRNIWDSALPVVNVPTNHGGLMLHRGRAGVEAASTYRPHHHYARLPNQSPHFMGVPDGASIWSEIERKHERALGPDGRRRADRDPRLASRGARQLGDDRLTSRTGGLKRRVILGVISSSGKCAARFYRPSIGGRVNQRRSCRQGHRG